MNYIADGILECSSNSGISDKEAKDILAHYGMKFRSGRYPYGSGDNPFQHEKKKGLTKKELVESDFLMRVEELRKKKGYTWTDDDGLWGDKGKVYTGDTAIAHYMGLSSGQFRAATEIAKEEIRSQERAIAVKMRNEGASYMAIANELGYKNDSSVRTLLNEDIARRKSAAMNNADFLRKMVDEHGFVDVGKGTERYFGVSREKWEQSIEILKLEGYEKYPRRFPQKTNPGKLTTFDILCKPGTEYKEVYAKDFTAESIYFPASRFVSPDGGETFEKKYHYPASMDSKRLAIRYSDGSGTETDGTLKDGVIEIRRGVADLDLGNSHYAQVRILVDGTHYIKGMAVYSDDLPEGKDILFNTNKPEGTPLEKVLKPIKRNPDGTPKEDPFGSLIKYGINDPDDPSFTSGGQSYYYDEKGEKKLSLINKRSDEGDWDSWQNKLPSQFLAKQRMPLITKQLNITKNLKQLEYDDIMSLDNPTIKKIMLDKFADSCEKASETLKAAALPRQHYRVILPLTSIKDDEIYAPGYEDGEKVCLVRFPHGGTFEIPYLTVNNRNKEGKNVITNKAADAVGISKKVADQLSGADFDGDTVLVIPTGGSVNIAHKPPLKDLEGFDTKMEYGGYTEKELPDGTKVGSWKLMTNTQNEMGKVSNLITDMTIMGAPESDLAKVVKHSMVIIDAEKHQLNYQQSAIDNDYAALKRKYQLHYTDEGKESTGAATLLSRANAKVDVPKRRGSGWVNPETGDKEYNLSGETFVKNKENKKEGTLSIINPKYNKETGETEYVETILKKDTGEVLYTGTPTRKVSLTPRTQKATQMSIHQDARELISPYDSKQENAYADYANSMKNMARSARLESLNTPPLKYSKEAKEKYADEVASLNAKLNEAIKNKPLERQAQFIADTWEKKAIENEPSLKNDAKELKKFKQQAITRARAQVGAHRNPIHFTDREWEAIQNGAISDNKLRDIITHMDDDELKQRATPHGGTVLSPAKISAIKSLANNGYTLSQIADQLQISTSTVSNYLK